MGNKTLIKQLQDAKFAGMCAGILFGLDIAAVATNHALGIGATRLDRVSKEVQEILDEIKSEKDCDRIRIDMVNELTRIYGQESRGFWLERYISVGTWI